MFTAKALSDRIPENKNEATWCDMLVGLKTPNEIRLEEYSTSSGVDGIPYLNWSGERWYLNFNWLENDWNSNDRLLCLRYSLHSLPIISGEFVFQRFLSNCPAFYQLRSEEHTSELQSQFHLA